MATLALKNPTEIFDDVRELSSYSNPSPFATLLQMEQAMHFSLRDDLLSQLQGEITIELESFVEPEPVWNVILRVHDPERLQKTLDQLFLSAPIQMRQFEKEGVRYHSLLLPSQRKPVEIVYAFADGYLIISSNYQSATKAIGLHKSGESLAKSTTFLAALPPGYSPDASVLFYEDAAAIAALQMRRLSPEIAEVFSHPSETIPITFCVYGEDSAIRSVSASGGPDPAAVLVIAAIAIPNLLRARSAANEASAVGTLRTVNTAQIAYSSTYPQKGYARALATLGPDPRDPSAYSPDHAGLIDAILGDASCTTGTWCTKSGYRFSLTAVCKTRACKEFVVVGTPVSSSTGTRTFCSTSDAVIRFNAGPVLTSPISASECREWPPIQ